MNESVARHERWLLAAVLLAPLFAMAVLPLHDTSEPRYAEIARLMAQTDDWVTPWFAPGVPFWGKPPLSFWAQAAAIKLMGLREFTLRLPAWLCWLATHAVLFAGVRRIHGARVALWTSLVYGTCALASICAGAVLTDPFLALGTTLSLVAFAVTVHEADARSVNAVRPVSVRPVFLNLIDRPFGAAASRRQPSPLKVFCDLLCHPFRTVTSLRQTFPSEIFCGLIGHLFGASTVRRQTFLKGVFWRYGFFLGLTIGLLAKGPLAVVLCGTPTLVWIGLQQWRQRWSWRRHRRSSARPSAIPRLPWKRGLLLTAALSLPWYILAELKTPGFLQYFLVGEHMLRFIDAGWAGDLYGTAHRQAPGKIWLYWLWASFPWGAGVLVALAAAACAPHLHVALRRSLRPVMRHPLSSYWLAAALCAPGFFTASANILWTYVLPALAGFSVLAALCIQTCLPFPRIRRSICALACITPVAVLILALRVWAQPDLGKTERGLVRYAQAAPDLPLIYLGPLPFSARFYSRGTAQRLPDDALAKTLASARTSTQPLYLAVPRARQEEMTALLGAFTPQYRNRRYILIRLPRAEHAEQYEPVE